LARESAAWDPLCAWFAARIGVPLALGSGVMAAPQSPALDPALAGAVAALDSFHLAALSLATRTAGSIVIGFALCEGVIDADTALAAAVIEDVFQEEKWGADAEAVRARAVKRLDLGHAARFVALLSEA
jgi:chaperone required for assembly of F1-ATPase